MNIDDMRVGDFLHLMDCMQEECYEQKVRTAKCYGCKYYDVCDIGIDPDDFDTYTLKKVIEEYAEMNGLIDHMHYVNDQKWIPVTKRLPKQNQIVIVTEDGEVKICTYELCYGYGYGFYGSRGKVTAWMPLPEPYKGGTANVDSITGRENTCKCRQI